MIPTAHYKLNGDAADASGNGRDDLREELR